MGKKIMNLVGLDRYYLLRQLSLYLLLFLKYNSMKKINNLIRCEYELLRKKTVLKSIPYVVKLEANNICNLDCEFCYRKTLNYGFGYTSFENFKKMFDPLKDYMYYCAPHYLGEPFLHKDMARILTYIHKNNVATYISSNLNYLTEDLARDVINSGLDLLTVSVDAVDQETYKKYRKGGDFNLVIKNLKMLVDQKKKLKSSTPLIELQFIIFKYNEHQIDKVEALAKEIGVDSLKIRPGIIDDEEWIPKNKMYVSKLYTKKNKDRKTCWWLWKTATITWNGEMFPCCRRILKKSFGNVLKEDFSAIWNNEQYVDARKCFSSKSKFDSPCYTCKVPYGNIHG